jgi:uncharacterized protein YjiS (DUF1127 family)
MRHLQCGIAANRIAHAAWATYLSTIGLLPDFRAEWKPKEADMAIIETSRPYGASPSLLSRLAAGVADIFAAVAEWNEARQTRNALSRLSDRELDDIGLSRAEIEALTLPRR